MERGNATIHRLLELELDALRARIAGEDATAVIEERHALSAQLTRPAPLDFLQAAFSLTDFERAAILLAAAPHYDPGLLGERPTPRLAFELFARSASERVAAAGAFLPTSPLRHHRLLELEDHASQLLRPLRIDERLTAFLAGLTTHDPRIQHFLEPLRPVKLAAAEREAAREVAALLTEMRKGAPRPIVNLVGKSGQRRIARGALSLVGANIVEVVASRLPGVDELAGVTGLLGREATLSRTAFFVDGTTHDVRNLAERLDTIVVVATPEPIMLSRETVVVRSPPLSTADQTELWKLTLDTNLDGAIGAVSQQFELDGDAIARIGAGVVERATRSGSAIRVDDVWAACREHAARALDGRATRVAPRHRWDEIVLPADSMEQLREIEGQVRARAVVLDQWGFRDKLTRGRGTAVMFTGPSGTGKTLAAEILARELGLELLRVDLAGVIDKYIGETEKNLRRIFEVAEASGAILLFDEADALFAARTDIKTSNDRYANVEVNYLLQQMEEYRGVAILATNRRAAIDRAFLRRLRFVVEFPHPDPASRRKIWERAFPPSTPVSGLDLDALARLDIAGGNIRTIAINAALAAAHAGESVTMKHVMTAARREYVKLDRIITQAEFGTAGVPR